MFVSILLYYQNVGVFYIGMDAHKFKKNFLYFYICFINIFCMKGKILTSLVCFCMFNTAYAAQRVVSSPSALLDSYDDGDELVINNGGRYNLSKLKTVSQNLSDVRIDFSIGPDAGTSESVVELVADTDFDGVFNITINKASNTVLELSEDFMNNHPVWTDDLLVFNNLVYEDAGAVIVQEETDSGIYSYELVACSGGVGKCVKRTYSSGYSVAHQNARRAARVAREGVQNNPKMLLRPLYVINHHELLDVFDFSDEDFISVVPEYYVSEDFYNLGLKFNAGTKIGGRLLVGVAVYVAEADFKNDVSEFKSYVYGGNLRFNYDIDDTVFVRGVGGLSLSGIDCDDVVQGNKTVDNPDGFSVYGGLDFGAKFNMESGLYLSPYVGVAETYESIVDLHDTDSFLHAGSDIGFSYFMDGVKYSYVLRVGIDTHGYFNADAGIGIWTVSDKIGGGVSVGVLDTDFGLSGKVSANIKLFF